MNDIDKIGIYFIRNIVSNMIYIGSTAESFRYRWHTHKSRLNTNKHCNRHLYRAWCKHGEDSFEFGILTIVEKIDDILSVEQLWLNIFNKDKESWDFVYNACKTAGSPLGYKHTKTARGNMSKAQKKVYAEKIANGELRSKEEQIGYINKYYKEYRKEYKLKNKDKIKKQRKEYYASLTPEQIKVKNERTRKWRAKMKPNEKIAFNIKRKEQYKKKKAEKQQAALIAANTYGQLSMFN